VAAGELEQAAMRAVISPTDEAEAVVQRLLSSLVKRMGQTQ
jgi:hypothetical protein